MRSASGRLAAAAACAVAVGLAGSPAGAAPALVPERAVIVGRAAPGQPWTDRATEARAGDGAELAVVVVARQGKRTVIVADGQVAPLRIDGRAVRAKARRDFGALGPVEVRWSTVEPHGFRTEAAANGATSPFYSNVSTEPRDFGRWLGYDHIEYFEREVAPWTGGEDARRIEARVTAGEPGAVQIDGLGTVRYKVEVALASGEVLASPGVEAVDRFGIRPTVHRVSIRAGDDFLGWLSAYLLVPEVFGSAGGGKNHQTERFVGADCADLMVGALRRTGRRADYTNVAGLGRLARVVVAATELDHDGMPATPITGVKRGDLIRIDYGGSLRNHTPRAWDHVAALWEDRSDPAGPHRGAADGQLDGFDLVIHMGHPRAIIEPLSEQAPATVDVLRWR